MINKTKTTFSIFCALIICSICLVFSSCQNNMSPADTSRDSMGSLDKNYNSVFDIEKNPLIHNHLNADISLNDSTIQLRPEDSLFGIICSSLGLNDPIITIFGFQDVDNNCPLRRMKTIFLVFGRRWNDFPAAVLIGANSFYQIVFF